MPSGVGGTGTSFLIKNYFPIEFELKLTLCLKDTHVPPSSTLCRVFQITPSLGDNRDKRGLALDGQLKHEDTNLASTTLYKVF